VSALAVDFEEFVVSAAFLAAAAADFVEVAVAVVALVIVVESAV
jgi:hypothetical protein